MREEAFGQQPVGKADLLPVGQTETNTPRQRQDTPQPVTRHLIRGCVEQSDNAEIQRRANPNERAAAWSRPRLDQAGSAASVSVQRFLPTKGSRCALAPCRNVCPMH